MGNALKDQGKLEEAIEAYKKALSLKPDYAGAYNNISREALSAIMLTGQCSQRQLNSAPREYVMRNYFCLLVYAYKFDQSLVEKLSYDIPKVITQLALEKHGRWLTRLNLRFRLWH